MKKKSEANKEDKIQTLHPHGKRGVRIDKNKYEIMRAAILRALKGGRGLTHAELFQAAESLLPTGFTGSTMWYFETVKLDLEARRLIERLTDTDPHRYRIKI
ncbi:MAG: hypothetical protein AB1715_00145 [Acidobacteriota bacterium]